MTIGGLVLASFWVIRPFLLAGVWATMIVVSTWPALEAVQARLWGRRSLAVLVMTIVMLLLIVAPVAAAVIGIASRAEDILGWSRSAAEFVLAGPPEWVLRVPIVGSNIAGKWAELAASPGDVSAQITSSVTAITRWLLTQIGTVGALLVQLLLTVVISAILYAKGETAAAGILAFTRRLGGAAGERVTILSGKAIRAVALGIVVTALVQAALGGVGLVVMGFPHALILTAVIFLLGIMQIPPLPVLLGVVIWGYSNFGAFWGTVILVWALGTGSLDNLLRPVLIKRGANLPLLLIFVGVLGGLFAFGVIGLFVGPVVLSVTYTLLSEWVAQDSPPRPAGDAPGRTGS